jgi:hypothetical protein
MNRTIVFDMDGTIADFYGVENWLIEIRNESTKPYEIAEPLYNIETLNTILEFLKMSGWRIVVTSWLAKDSTKEYKEKVRKAKLEWLKKYDFPFDEIHLVQYGTTKANCTRRLGGFQVLVDDNEKIRKGWSLGDTINANENILEKLINLA